MELFVQPVTILPADMPTVMQVVIGTVLEGYQTLAKIASQQTFKPNQKIQQVSISAISATVHAYLELQVCMSILDTRQRMPTGCSSTHLHNAACV